MTILPGHEYTVRLYVNNAAADNLNSVAENVRAHINLPVRESTFGHQFEVNGYLYSSNSTPSEIWDNIVLKGKQPFHVRVIDQRYYNNWRTEDTGGFPLGDELINSKGVGAGALLGYQSMDGRIRGTYQESGYVLVKFRPVFQLPTWSGRILYWVNQLLSHVSEQVNTQNDDASLDNAHATQE